MARRTSFRVRPVLAPALILLTAGAAPAQQEGPVPLLEHPAAPLEGESPHLARDWQRLVDAGDLEGARALCSRWLQGPGQRARAEAHKCLANVVLADAGALRLEGGADDGSGRIEAGFAAEPAAQALEHLNRALELTPQDLSLHQGRLHVLMTAGRYHETAAALRDSVERYAGADALEAWLAYSPRFHEAGRYRDGIRFLEVIERRYPDDHRIPANLGAFYALLEEDAKALPYARRAVELRPGDPINNWNLGRLYDYMGEIEAADRYYRKAMKLDAEGGVVDACVYAAFVEERVGDTERACAVRAERCPSELGEGCR